MLERVFPGWEHQSQVKEVQLDYRATNSYQFSLTSLGLKECQKRLKKEIYTSFHFKVLKISILMESLPLQKIQQEEDQRQC